MASLSGFDGYGGYYSQQIINGTPPDSAFMREYYRLLYAYYQQNGLYDYINDNLQATRQTDKVIKPLRNPAWRVVETYAAKLIPGVPKIITPNERILEPLKFIWGRSNFVSEKERWVRWFSIFGDLFLKINIDEEKTKVWIEAILPEYVTDLEVDERGFLTEIRIDVPLEGEKFYTEYWSKELQTVQIWEHEQGLDKELEELGSPTSTAGFAEMYNDDFIPIVYQPFRNDGGGRGSGCYAAQLDKIDEVNRQATRLAQTLFRYNRALWAIETNGVDSTGRPLPMVTPAALENSDGNIQIGDDTMLSLPANSKLSTLVPPINFNAALEALESQLRELAADLPELTYYELTSQDRETSGRAIRFLLDGMISRVELARVGMESAIVRANQMAITVGQNNSVFPRVGEFINGDFEHELAKMPILPRDIYEEAQIIGLLTNGGIAIEAAAKFIGQTDEQAEALAEVGAYFESQSGGR